MRGQNFTCWWGCRTRGLGRVPCAESTEMSMGTFQGSLWGNLGPERRSRPLFTHCHLKNGNHFSAEVRTILRWPLQTQLSTVGGCDVWRCIVAPGPKLTLYLSHPLFPIRACESAHVLASIPTVTERKDTVLLAATQMWPLLSGFTTTRACGSLRGWCCPVATEPLPRTLPEEWCRNFQWWHQPHISLKWTPQTRCNMEWPFFPPLLLHSE